MLFQAPKLNAEETAVLQRIEQLKAELGYGLTPRRWFGLLRRNTFARAVQGSNSIEGINVSIEDAMAAVEEEEPLNADKETWAAINGYRMALTFILQKVDDPYFTYSAEFLNALHFLMLGYDLSKHPGRWRPGPIHVRNDKIDEIVYEGPDIEMVPGLMFELIAWLNSSDGVPPFIKAAMAHLNLVLVHPYSDANGRMSRALQTLVLARSGGALQPFFISIEEYLGRNTEDYYNALAETAGGSWQPERSARPWIRFCLTAHYRQATTIRRRATYYQKIFEALEREIERQSLMERMLLAVTEAAIGFKVRNATYRNSADISDTIATRDLKQLVDAGLLEPKGEKRGRYYIASSKVRDITKNIERPGRVGDPFEELKEDAMVLPGMEGFRGKV